MLPTEPQSPEDTEDDAASVAPEASGVPHTPEPNPTTLHQRIEDDRASTPDYSPGTGSNRLAALVAAAKARLETPKST